MLKLDQQLANSISRVGGNDRLHRHERPFGPHLHVVVLSLTSTNIYREGAVERAITPAESSISLKVPTRAAFTPRPSRGAYPLVRRTSGQIFKQLPPRYVARLEAERRLAAFENRAVMGVVIPRDDGACSCRAGCAGGGNRVESADG